MWTAILWPALLVVIYALLFGMVLFMAHRFTRGFDNEEPATEQPAPEHELVGATPHPAP